MGGIKKAFEEDTKLKEDYQLLIQDWFADCTTPREVAILYADLLHEIKIQLDYMMENLQVEDN